jgi:hypothetical protein
MALGGLPVVHADIGAAAFDRGWDAVSLGSTMPPTTRSVPFRSNVPVWKYRGVCSRPVRDQTPVVGSYTSAV